MTADELRAAEPGISDEDIKIEQEDQQKELDEQKARTTKIEAMLAESRGGSKGIQPTASPVEVPPPAPYPPPGDGTIPAAPNANIYSVLFFKV